MLRYLVMPMNMARTRMAKIRSTATAPKTITTTRVEKVCSSLEAYTLSVLGMSSLSVCATRVYCWTETKDGDGRLTGMLSLPLPGRSGLAGGRMGL